jgi:hypothetical protein
MGDAICGKGDTAKKRRDIQDWTKAYYFSFSRRSLIAATMGFVPYLIDMMI